MRGGEGLVQIEMHHVKSHIARTDNSKESIHIGAVIVKETTAIVNKLRYFANILLEQTERVRIGHHNSRNVRSKQRLERLDVDQTVFP